MDNAINSILQSLKSFFTTFYQAIFFPKTLFTNVYRSQTERYLQPFLYLVICCITVFSIQTTFIKSSHVYIRENLQLIDSIRNQLGEISVLNQVFYSLPLALLLFAAIKVIAHFLFKDKKQRLVFLTMGQYWAGSFCILYCLLKFFAALFVNSFINYKLKTDLDFISRHGYRLPFVSPFLYYVQLAGYFVTLGAICFFFKKIDRTVVKFLCLSVVAGSSFFLINRLIDTELKALKFIQGDEVEFYASNGSRLSHFSFTPRYLIDSSVLYSTQVYIKNKTSYPIQILPQRSFRVVVDTTDNSLESCDISMPFPIEFSMSSSPATAKDTLTEGVFIVKPSQKIFINMEFRSNCLITETKSRPYQKMSISLYYKAADANPEDGIFMTTPRQYYVNLVRMY